MQPIGRKNKHLSPHQPTRPAPRSPAPVAGTEPPEQKLAPPCPRLWMQPLRRLGGGLWRQSHRPLWQHLHLYPAISSGGSSNSGDYHQRNIIDEAKKRSGETEKKTSVVCCVLVYLHLHSVGSGRLHLLSRFSVLLWRRQGWHTTAPRGRLRGSNPAKAKLAKASIREPNCTPPHSPFT